jgi:hypothetical protein
MGGHKKRSLPRGKPPRIISMWWNKFNLPPTLRIWVKRKKRIQNMKKLIKTSKHRRSPRRPKRFKWLKRPKWKKGLGGKIPA